MIIAIDPGPIYSACVFIKERNLSPESFGKVKNCTLVEMLDKIYKPEHVAIEMVASYGMPVGVDVFETCVWIGRFQESVIRNGAENIKFIFRKDEKINLCGTMKAKDSNIRQALIDRFAQHDFKNGKGTKQKPDWFHGFNNDIWQAYAVGVTYYDLHLKEVNNVR